MRSVIPTTTKYSLAPAVLASELRKIWPTDDTLHPVAKVRSCMPTLNTAKSPPMSKGEGEAMDYRKLVRPLSFGYERRVGFAYGQVGHVGGNAAMCCRNAVVESDW